MALVIGTNCGFVLAAPIDDPAAVNMILSTTSKAFKDVSPALAAKVVEIGWWCDTASEAADFEVGIYDHNVGDNNPENLLGKSPPTAKGITAGWKRVTGLNIAINPSETYWLAVQLDDTATTTYNNEAGGGTKRDIKGVQTELVDPWGVSDITNAYLLGIYAITEEGGAPPAAAKFGSLNRDYYGPEQHKGLYTEL